MSQYKENAMKQTKSTCCYCGVGCGVIIHSENNKIIDVKGDPDHPANAGRLCTKGATLHLSARPENRLLYPELRMHKTLPRHRTGWDETLDYVADRFADTIKTHGPDSVAFYISGQLLTEDYYVFNKLAKGLIGTNNVDSNSRLCMSSAVAGYKATLGADAPPTCYEDIDHTGCLLIAGSNTAYAHPVLFRRIEAAKANNPDLKIIVVDPRKTDTAMSADLHLAILPGTDVALFNGMLHVLLWEGLLDNAFIKASTTGFDTLKDTVREYTPKMVADICGIQETDIITAAKWFGAGPSLSLYCMGLNQSIHGTDKNAALINLHLASGQIGKPGAGPFSLTGQPNAMGGREVGGMANLMSGHRDLSNAQHRAEIAHLWGVERVPEHVGKTAVEMFEAINAGTIKAIWIACTNPAHSMPDVTQVLAALDEAALVVVQDAFDHTSTAAYADVLLPASTWGEKEGVVTNSERRVTRVNTAVAAPGEARHDWAITVDFARRLEKRLGNTATLFPYETPEDIFNEHRETTRGRDLDITGLSYALLNEQGPQQWPYPAGAASGQARLYSDGVFATADGRARFVSAHYKPSADRINARHPLHLLTGRLRDQWHGMSRTGTVAQLFNHAEAPFIYMHPEDMRRRLVKAGDIVKVSNARGSLVLPVKSSEEVQVTQTFIPMHWSSQFMNSPGVNVMMPAAFDARSKQPELKHTAITLEKLTLPWRLTVMRALTDLGQLQQMRAFLSRFDYASCGLFGRQQQGYAGMLIFRAAHAAAPDASLIAEIDAILGMTDDRPLIHYQDDRRGISKRILVETQSDPLADSHADASSTKRVTGIRLVGETLAAEWLQEVMTAGTFNDEIRKWALAPLSAPPLAHTGRGKVICSCLDVAEHAIVDAITRGADLITLQNKFKCGTQCGSCVPELKRLVAAHANA